MNTTSTTQPGTASANTDAGHLNTLTDTIRSLWHLFDSQAAVLEGPSAEDSFSVGIPEATFAAGVVILLNDRHVLYEEGLELVALNRAPIATARHMGFEAWEIAEYIRMNTQ